jgi:hypothetical protein
MDTTVQVYIGIYIYRTAVVGDLLDSLITLAIVVATAVPFKVILCG